MRSLPRSILAVAVLVLGLGGPALYAQALPTAIGPGTYLSVGGGASYFPSDYSGRKLGGGMVYTQIQPSWRIGLEGEARYLRLNTDEQVDQTNYLAGVRVVLSPLRLRPYAKFLVGATRINAPFGYAQGTFFTYAPGAGVDYFLTNRLILRAADVEYQIVPQFLGSNVRNLGVSVGLSLRLNELIRYPRGNVLRR